ncbi:MAG: hypothetical protein A4E47_00323 [Methanosaeta sp. PtaU1.Bin028]|nr:MAG: hypothetical protein A4E47_00323 [Methanosaeta sp. PtaU1.Bin028]
MKPLWQAVKVLVYANLCIPVSVSYYLVSLLVCQKQISDQPAHGLHLLRCCGPLRQSRRGCVIGIPPGLEVAADEKVRLVEGNPIGDQFGEAIGNLSDVIGIDIRKIGPYHSSTGLHMKRPGEMMKRQYWGHIAGADLLDQLSVVIESVLIPPVLAEIDPGPGNREAKRIASQLLCKFDILLIPIPEVGCPTACCLRTPYLFPPIADVRVLWIKRLTLMIRGGNSENEMAGQWGELLLPKNASKRVSQGHCLSPSSKKPSVAAIRTMFLYSSLIFMAACLYQLRYWPSDTDYVIQTI